MSDIPTTGDRRAHYSVHVGAVHNVLVKDLKVENPVVHLLSINTRSTRSVFLRAVVGRDAIIEDRQSVVEGKSVSVRVDLGGRRIIKTKLSLHQPTDPLIMMQRDTKLYQQGQQYRHRLSH